MAQGWLGSASSAINFPTPVYINLTMGANEYPNGSITFDNVADSNAYWKNNHSSRAESINLYLCDSAGNNRIFLFTIALNGGGSNTTINSATISGAQALAGQALYLVATGNGYYGDDQNFIQLRRYTTITVQTAELNHSVNCYAGTGGSLTASTYSAAPGTTVTLYPSANTGYQFSEYGTDPYVAISNNQFVMPSYDVNVAAYFEQIVYTISTGANPSAGGSLSVNYSQVHMGDTVTLTPSAAAGYQFSGYSTSPEVSISNNQFTVPASNVSVTANFTKINYTVSRSVSPSGGGSLTSNVSTAQMGDTVTLTATPATGYQFSSYSSSPSVTISNNQFTMPAGNVSITANFTKINYSVSTGVSPSGSGTLTSNVSTAKMGDTVTLTPTAATGYQFSSYSTSPSVSISNNKFTMPASNVSITANFTKISYSITRQVTPTGGGSLTTNVNSAKMGDTVTVTATAATGYQLSSITTSPSVTISNNKFTMPASAITITATFTKITYTVSKAVSPSGAGTVTTSANSATMGTSITISQTPATGYSFKEWGTSPSVTISNGAFSMPASNITVTAYYRHRSSGSLNKSSIAGGDSVTLTISTESTSYSHKYKLSWGTGMDSGWVNVAAGTTSVSISVPLSWSTAIPSATSKTGGTLTLQTYNGSSQIGNNYTISNLTYTVPASVTPTLGTITKSIARTIGGTTYANVGNYYVQSHCGVRVQASASGAQGSTISSMTVSIAGYSGSSYTQSSSSGSLDKTSGLLYTSGTTSITVSATDSRGRTVSKTETITVTAYSNPSGSLSIHRVDANGNANDSGAYAVYSLTKSYSAIGSNSLTRTMTSKGSSATLSSDSGNILPNSRQTFDIQQEYQVTVTLADAFETTTITSYVRSARFLIYVNAAGDKLGFMKATTKSTPSGKSGTIEFSGDYQIYIGDSKLEDYIRSIANS